MIIDMLKRKVTKTTAKIQKLCCLQINVLFEIFGFKTGGQFRYCSRVCFVIYNGVMNGFFNSISMGVKGKNVCIKNSIP